MKEIISQLIDDFQERSLPKPTPRETRFHDIAGKANVVIGMRRAGKTWFCFQKINELLEAGVPKKEILYLNFEDDRLFEFQVKDFQAIVDAYFAKFPENRNGVCHFFFDELQRVDQWELFIRRLLDTEDVRVYLTGSSSKLLSAEIATSLRGRSLASEIFPFGFAEYLRHCGLFEKAPQTFGSRTVSVLRKAARDYLEIGGFPEVQNIESQFRIEVLQNYMDSVLLKDVVERHNVRNVAVLKHLLRHVMNACGGKFSVNKFYNTMRSMRVKCTKNDLYGYLGHLTDAFVFSRVPIHTRSERARTINPAKFYPIDTGLVNAMTFRNSADNGPLLETMVFMKLRRDGCEVEYVNTKDGYETDFLATDRITGERSLIQSCWDLSDERTFGREVCGIRRAMEELSISRGELVTWDDELIVDDAIRAIPVWKWLVS